MGNKKKGECREYLYVLNWNKVKNGQRKISKTSKPTALAMMGEWGRVPSLFHPLSTSSSSIALFFSPIQ